MTTPFRYRFRVRYAECDAQKVVFNARFGDYVDLAVLEFLRALGFAKMLFAGPLDYQVVKQAIEWKSSARFDQVLDASVQTVRVGNTSFTLATEFRIVPGNELVATAETVYVLVDARELTKTPVPEEIRGALERGAPGVVVDQSGNPPGG